MPRIINVIAALVLSAAQWLEHLSVWLKWVAGNACDQALRVTRGRGIEESH